MSEFKDTDLYGTPGIGSSRIQDRLRDPVLLKHWWDQYGLEAADVIDRLERELDKVKKLLDIATGPTLTSAEAVKEYLSARTEVGTPGSPVKQRIVCAAIRNGLGHIICGPRHFDEIMRAQVVGRTDWKQAEQGFVDQRGHFLNRKQALAVAEEAGQIVRRCGGDETELFSENLY